MVEIQEFGKLPENGFTNKIFGVRLTEISLNNLEIILSRRPGNDEFRTITSLSEMSTESVPPKVTD
jgi:hypothetical protein